MPFAGQHRGREARSQAIIIENAQNDTGQWQCAKRALRITSRNYTARNRAGGGKQEIRNIIYSAPPETGNIPQIRDVAAVNDREPKNRRECGGKGSENTPGKQAQKFAVEKPRKKGTDENGECKEWAHRSANCP